MSNDPRQTALWTLNALEGATTTLDRIMAAAFEAAPQLDRRDRALANALVYGVQRWRGRLDWIIAHFSRTPLERMDPPIRNILRLGLFQIAFMERIPVSAAVNTAVELAKQTAAPWAARFVNGVLRNAARGLENVPFPELSGDPVGAIAATRAFPRWLVERWLQRFGLQETLALCDAANAIPPITLRTNTLKTSRAALLAALQSAAEAPQPTLYAPEGIRCARLREALTELPPFQQGWCQVQDEAAQLVTHLLDPRPGERVLDACAGRGGKTGHIAQRLRNRGLLVALDNDNLRLAELAGELQRLGVGCAEIVPHDLAQPPKNLTPWSFDRVLLDAPCSGLGVLRRNPDTKWAAERADLGRFGERQLGFLKNLAPLVRPGGRLVYAVCSLEPEETDAVVAAFLDAVPGFDLARSAADGRLAAAGLVDAAGALRTLPHRHHMDGFFAVGLRRRR
ncbi:MAG: 16S rRNA (cytosine(967)-C(5))-methyltransferase RsmB [Desulfobacteraceae bacterium]|nr:16S rRNA (cytosine(967)-C(5))-methyltransferase RsmB [Desulfobacteraceae bacterium]